MSDKRQKAKGERLMSKGGLKFKEFRVEFGRRVKSLRFTSAKLYSKFFKFKTPFTHYPFASCRTFFNHRLTQITLIYSQSLCLRLPNL